MRNTPKKHNVTNIAKLVALGNMTTFMKKEKL